MVQFDAKKQAEAIKKLSQIADKVSTGKIDLEEASEKIDGLKPVNTYSGDSGSINFREHKTIVITDEAKIPRSYMIPDLVKIRADIIGGAVIPGVEIKIEKIVAKGKA
jgi:hypothetical protein